MGLASTVYAEIWIVPTLLFVAAVLVTWYIGKEYGVTKTYEKKAGKPIVLGKDPIPKRFKDIKFLIRNVEWCGWSNSHRRGIINCEIILLDKISETITFDKWIKKEEEIFYRDGNIFHFSDLGQPIFDYKPKI